MINLLITLGGGVSILSIIIILWIVRFRKKMLGYKERYIKIVNQKKSSEVRLGKIGENLAPFLENWPWDLNKFHFIGYPTDGIQFNDDEVIFVEIKTGKSRLTPTQRKIRDIVKAGKVGFAVFRIGEEKAELKRIEGMEDEEDIE